VSVVGVSVCVCVCVCACVRVKRYTHETRSLACYYNDANDNGDVITPSLNALLKTQLCHGKGILNIL